MFERLINWLASKTPAYRKLQERHDRDHKIIATYAVALRSIVDSANSITTPNGTIRKHRRIATEAFSHVADAIYGKTA
jgi:hypothetical protein